MVGANGAEHHTNISARMKRLCARAQPTTTTYMATAAGTLHTAPLPLTIGSVRSPGWFNTLIASPVWFGTTPPPPFRRSPLPRGVTAYLAQIDIHLLVTVLTTNDSRSAARYALALWCRHRSSAHLTAPAPLRDRAPLGRVERSRFVTLFFSPRTLKTPLPRFRTAASTTPHSCSFAALFTVTSASPAGCRSCRVAVLLDVLRLSDTAHGSRFTAWLLTAYTRTGVLHSARCSTTLSYYGYVFGSWRHAFVPIHLAFWSLFVVVTPTRSPLRTLLPHLRLVRCAAFTVLFVFARFRVVPLFLRHAP